MFESRRISTSFFVKLSKFTSIYSSNWNRIYSERKLNFMSIWPSHAMNAAELSILCPDIHPQQQTRCILRISKFQYKVLVNGMRNGFLEFSLLHWLSSTFFPSVRSLLIIDPSKKLNSNHSEISMEIPHVIMTFLIYYTQPSTRGVCCPHKFIMKSFTWWSTSDEISVNKFFMCARLELELISFSYIPVKAFASSCIGDLRIFSSLDTANNKIYNPVRYYGFIV